MCLKRNAFQRCAFKNTNINESKLKVYKKMKFREQCSSHLTFIAYKRNIYKICIVLIIYTRCQIEGSLLNWSK